MRYSYPIKNASRRAVRPTILLNFYLVLARKACPTGAVTSSLARGYLKRSLKNVSPYTICTCTCDYSTARSDSLLIHTRKHTGVKLLYCEYCDYSTGDSCRLAIHVRTHTGDKPFKCDDCDYRAVIRHAIGLHRRIHTGEKPYKCDNCDYRAAQRHYITSHKKAKHTVLKPCQM